MDSKLDSRGIKSEEYQGVKPTPDLNGIQEVGGSIPPSSTKKMDGLPRTVRRKPRYGAPGLGFRRLFLLGREEGTR